MAFPTDFDVTDGDPNKPLVLLLHGAFDYSGAFDELGPKLAAQGFTALAFDQRGFGATRSRRRWCGTKRMVHDVVDAIRFLRDRNGALPLFDRREHGRRYRRPDRRARPWR